MKRFRFSLASMIAATTALAVVIGLGQARWRIVRELNQLQVEGVGFEHDADAIESIEGVSWFSNPDYAEIYVLKHSPDEYVFERSTYSREKAIAYGKSLESRLKEVGVEEIYIYFQWPEDGSVAQKVLQSFDELPN